MSQQANQWLRRWEVVADSLHRTSFVRDGIPLSKRDASTWAEALLLQSHLMNDLAFSTPCDFREAKSWATSVAQLDVLEVINVLKSLDDFLLLSVESPHLADYASFKHSLRTKWRNTGLILSPVRNDVREYVYSPSVEKFRVLHQFCSFLGRVSFRDILDDSVVKEFLETDASLRPPDLSLARAINRVLRDWLKGFVVDSFPTHGPGSTADAGRESLLAKYSHLGSDSLLDYVLGRHGLTASEFSPMGLSSWERTAKLQCVPKNARTQRTICMEPATLQYYQQMVRRSLYDFMHSQPAIARHIDLKDQTKNREAARRGSVDGSLVTIDLSKASDSVTWDLARIAFRGTTLLPWLYATRSRRVDVGQGTIVAVKKFAPMGSALCFPVECLLFAAVCEVAMRDYGRYCSTRYYSVYGDDIIVGREIVPVVMSYLGSLGFTVNRDKTFVNHTVLTFRESCGGEFLDGLDVSPLRIPRRFRGVQKLTAHHPDLYECYLTLANSCWERGYLSCRRWLIHRLHTLPRHLLPPFGEGGNSLHTFTRTNFRLRRRKMSYSQKGIRHILLWESEVRHGNPKTVVRDTDESAEKCRLYHWLVMAELHNDRQIALEAKIGRVKAPTLESVWTLNHWI